MKRQWPVIVIACILAISVGFYVTWSKRLPPGVIQAAEKLGIPPRTYADLQEILTKGSEGRLSEEEFQRVIEYSKHENASVRMRAFQAIANCDEEPLRSRAIVEVERMKADADEGISKRYAYSLYRLNAPNWREEYMKLLDSPDPAQRADAERVLGE